MGVGIGALVLFAENLDRTVEFYRLLGVPLVVDDHGDDDEGPLHYACDLGGCHFAVFPGEGETTAPGFRKAGASFPGIVVESVTDVMDAVRGFGAAVIQEPSPYPWGVRAVVTDPDGRPVEVYQPS